MKFIISVLLSLVTLLGGAQTVNYGAVTTFSPVQGKTYYLAGAGINNTQTTIQLSSFTLPDPNNTPIQNSMFSGTQYGVLEAQSSKIENVTFTGVTQNANGTALLTGVTRGIPFYAPFTGSSTLSLSHAGGATFILSNPAAFYSQFSSAQNANYWLATQTFSSTTPPMYDASPVWINFASTTLADVQYVNSVVASGAANATTLVKGIIQLSTATQLAAGTAVGSTGANLVVPGSFFNATEASTTQVPVTGTNGKLAQAFLDLTQSFTFSNLFSTKFTANGTSTFNGATLLNSPGQNYIAGATTVSYPLPMVLNAGTVIPGNSATASSTLAFVGFSTSNLISGNSVFVQTSGIVSGFSGLSTGADYYLQDGGGIGTSVGTLEAYVGTAVSSTQLQLGQLRTLQYAGTVSQSSGASFQVPYYTREVVIQINQNFSSYWQITLNKIGNTTGQMQSFSTNTGGGSSGSIGTSCTWSGNTISCASSGSFSVAINQLNAYFYR